MPRGAAMNLRALVELVTPQLSRAAARMWAAEPAIECYRRWLRVSYDLLRATAPILAEATIECLRRDDGLTPLLVPYFADQLAHEHGHEGWIEQDYAATGGDPAELAGRVPAGSAARLAGAQYYWLKHAHPVALIGHIAVLEWHPPNAARVDSLIARTGLAPQALRTITRHIELDAGHGRDLTRLLARLTLSQSHQRLIRASALGTAYGLVELMAEIAEP